MFIYIYVYTQINNIYIYIYICIYKYVHIHSYNCFYAFDSTNHYNYHTLRSRRGLRADYDAQELRHAAKLLRVALHVKTEYSNGELTRLAETRLARNNCVYLKLVSGIST